ncbi:MAG: cbb3-type cytochrome c oxidase subunit 3 [Myxococcota bacterium]
MNPVLHAGAETAQMGWLLGFTTVLFLATMVGWSTWAFWPGHKRMFEEAGAIPLDGGEQ